MLEIMSPSSEHEELNGSGDDRRIVAEEQQVLSLRPGLYDISEAWI